MESMKIITVCGAGVGTSTLLRMNISKAFDSGTFKVPITKPINANINVIISPIVENPKVLNIK